MAIPASTTWAGPALAAALAAAVAMGAQAAPYRAPRTAYGAPDLQGFWTNVSDTRLEREAGLPLTLPAAEEAAYEKRAVEAVNSPARDPLGQRPSEWLPVYGVARIGGRVRTSFIVSPADGKLPYNEAGKKRLAAFRAGVMTAADGPEARTGSDRCVMGSAGPPMENTNAAAGRQIVQTRDAVVILSEVNHEARVIRLGAPNLPARHPAKDLRFWTGDSIGHWEGETLVIETTNFHPQEGGRGNFLMSPDAKITERLTRTSAADILYAYEVDDPATFTQIWKAEMPLKAEPIAQLYEYACHEGNYSMQGILAGARRAEAEARKAVAEAAGPGAAR